MQMQGVAVQGQSYIVYNNEIYRLRRADVQSGFVRFCQDKIQGHSSTFQGLNFRIQGHFEWGQMNQNTLLLICLLPLLTTVGTVSDLSNK